MLLNLDISDKKKENVMNAGPPSSGNIQYIVKPEIVEISQLVVKNISNKLKFRDFNFK